MLPGRKENACYISNSMQQAQRKDRPFHFFILYFHLIYESGITMLKSMAVKQKRQRHKIRQASGLIRRIRILPDDLLYLCFLQIQQSGNRSHAHALAITF